MTRAATATNVAPSPSSIPPTRWPGPTGIRMSPPSSRSNASSTPATPRPGSCATPARRPSTSRTRRSLPPAPPKLSVRTGKSKTPPITAATSPWAELLKVPAAIAGGIATEGILLAKSSGEGWHDHKPNEGRLARSRARCACKPRAEAAEVYGGSREHVV